MLETIKECPVCSTNEYTNQVQCKDYTVSNEKFEIVRCNNCSFLFTNPRPEEALIGKYYKSDNYISHSNTSKGLINKLYHQVRNITLNQKLKLINKLSPEKGKILDVGCGTGYFLKTCINNNWEAYGTEPDDSTRKYASDYTGIVIKDSLFTLQDKFNIITLWHVLEHIHQLDKNLQKLVELLDQKGKLIIAVPNCNSYDANYYKEYWAAYDVPRHLYHFTPESINKLVSRYNLIIKEIVPMKFDSFYISMISEKYQCTDHNKSFNLLNLIKAFLIGLKSNLKAGKNNYSSNIYIIEKKIQHEK